MSRFEYIDGIEITIPINPMPNLETRFTCRGGYAVAYTDPKKKDYMNSILPFLHPYHGWAEPDDCVRAVFKFYMRPRRIVNKKSYFLLEKPDTDNLVKATKDTLGNGRILKIGKDIISGAGVMEDDYQICDERSIKMVSDQPRIVIKLWKIIDTTRQKPKQGNLFS